MPLRRLDSDTLGGHTELVVETYARWVAEAGVEEPYAVRDATGHGYLDDRLIAVITEIETPPDLRRKFLRAFVEGGQREDRLAAADAARRLGAQPYDVMRLLVGEV